MNRPRVLIFSLAYFPFVGGAEVAVKELTDRLGGYFEFEIISADIKNFWSKYFFPFWASRQAKRQHRLRKYDLVWSIMANQAGMAGALFKKYHPGIPFLLTLQEGDDLDSFFYRLRLLAPRLFGVFARPDQIQVISNYLAGWAKKMGARCPIVVIPNGVDLSKFGNREGNLEKVIITTSRLVKKNGIDSLVRSLAFLPDDVKLQILGLGPEEKALRRLVTSLQLSARVSFLGQIESKNVGQYLSHATVFARPSRSEGLGNSFLEAMAAGLPVIATPVGGITDFLREGETGWFCEVNNPRSISEKVKFILAPENQEQVTRIVSNARKMVYENYDWNKLAERFTGLLKQML
ncbi:glycosyltransferase family 4 protein [Candidatus Nomurabacteria bacterium]|nr:glycosyltransferase family 4 protein [Candidatus Nomurabacteria bacterium]